MALASQIPAITGRLRKRLILDLSVALGGGTVAGYAYWCVLRCLRRSLPGSALLTLIENTPVLLTL